MIGRRTRKRSVNTARCSGEALCILLPPWVRPRLVPNGRCHGMELVAGIVKAHKET